ncbi:hypothetical protein SS50377_25402 [Spironucleus salmonicida]|uniref:Uncharacterized protein n=1 Tax=Spironucleus salmonicida TaxID=348837 RepID=V6LK71_9EUKA|nr:hypothetical protein SS50377_25402 [Spironucleus salmonicida]|eukprot:EST44947.1 Hypothetical protein SS50377_14964 [Spironucleus salmonicida]
MNLELTLQFPSQFTSNFVQVCLDNDDIEYRGPMQQYKDNMVFKFQYVDEPTRIVLKLDEKFIISDFNIHIPFFNISVPELVKFSLSVSIVKQVVTFNILNITTNIFLPRSQVNLKNLLQVEIISDEFYCVVKRQTQIRLPFAQFRFNLLISALILQIPTEFVLCGASVSNWGLAQSFFSYEVNKYYICLLDCLLLASSENTVIEPVFSQIVRLGLLNFVFGGKTTGELDDIALQLYQMFGEEIKNLSITLNFGVSKQVSIEYFLQKHTNFLAIQCIGYNIQNNVKCIKQHDLELGGNDINFEGNESLLGCYNQDNWLFIHKDQTSSIAGKIQTRQLEVCVQNCLTLEDQIFYIDLVPILKNYINNKQSKTILQIEGLEFVIQFQNNDIQATQQVLQRIQQEIIIPRATPRKVSIIREKDTESYKTTGNQSGANNILLKNIDVGQIQRVNSPNMSFPNSVQLKPPVTTRGKQHPKTVLKKKVITKKQSDSKEVQDFVVSESSQKTDDQKIIQSLEAKTIDQIQGQKLDQHRKKIVESQELLKQAQSNGNYLQQGNDLENVNLNTKDIQKQVTTQKKCIASQIEVLQVKLKNQSDPKYNNTESDILQTTKCTPVNHYQQQDKVQLTSKEKLKDNRQLKAAESNNPQASQKQQPQFKSLKVQESSNTQSNPKTNINPSVINSVKPVDITNCLPVQESVPSVSTTIITSIKPTVPLISLQQQQSQIPNSDTFHIQLPSSRATVQPTGATKTPHPQDSSPGNTFDIAPKLAFDKLSITAFDASLATVRLTPYREGVTTQQQPILGVPVIHPQKINQRSNINHHEQLERELRKQERISQSGYGHASSIVVKKVDPSDAKQYSIGQKKYTGGNRATVSVSLPLRSLNPVLKCQLKDSNYYSELAKPKQVQIIEKYEQKMMQQYLDKFGNI